MRVLAMVFMLLLAPATGLAATVVEDVRTWNGPDHTRVVFDLSAPADHELFTLEGPHRAVVDLADARLDPALVERIRSEGPIQRIRSGRRDSGVRIVFDLDRALAAESFSRCPQ